MNDEQLRALYIALLQAMLANIKAASTARAHNHIKLLFSLGELTGLRSQRLDPLPKKQTLALACWKALDGEKAVAYDYAPFEQYDDAAWGKAQELCRDFLGMFGISTNTNNGRG